MHRGAGLSPGVGRSRSGGVRGWRRLRGGELIAARGGRTGLLAAEFQLLVSEATRALLRDGGAGWAGEIVPRGRQVATRLWSEERAR